MTYDELLARLEELEKRIELRTKDLGYGVGVYGVALINAVNEPTLNDLRKIIDNAKK